MANNNYIQSGRFPNSSTTVPHPSNSQNIGVHNLLNSLPQVPSNNYQNNHGLFPPRHPNPHEQRQSVHPTNNSFHQAPNFNPSSNNFALGFSFSNCVSKPPPNCPFPPYNSTIQGPNNFNSNGFMNNIPPNNPQMGNLPPFHTFNNNFQPNRGSTSFNPNRPGPMSTNIDPHRNESIQLTPPFGQSPMVHSNQKSFKKEPFFNSPNVSFRPPQYSFQVPPPFIENDNLVEESVTLPHVKRDKEKRLDSFLEKFRVIKKETSKSNLTLAEFRSCLQKSLSLAKMILIKRQKLESLLESSQEEWDAEFKEIAQIKNQLSTLCDTVSAPSNLNVIQRRLKLIKKKRETKLKLKQEASNRKIKKEQEREAISHEIDKWLDTIQEKNLKEKREIEMKKEADSILSEVRRKIHEAKKTAEKLKVLEKLRQVRQTSAEQKGLISSQDQNAIFEAKLSEMRSLLQLQLQDYEAEERALRVMLETEQGGRRDREAEWRIQRAKGLQERRKRRIVEGLFGDAEEPSSEDPLFLFFQFHNSGNSSIENLVQIRHHWDVHLSKDGEAIPQQWVVPVAATNSSWEVFCNKE